MPDLKDRYLWEAETASGKVITSGGDLGGCIRFSLIPADGVPLPRHDIVGVAMERRFCRNFTKTQLNGTEVLSGKFFWMDGSDAVATSEDQVGILKRGDLIGKGVAGERYYIISEVQSDKVILSEPYSGLSKTRGMQAKRLTLLGKQRRICLHCIVCEGFRIWINYAGGSMLITDKDREVYL